MSKYDPYSCLDLTAALQACAGDPDDPESAERMRLANGDGKVLLIVTVRGLELVRVPKILH